MPREPRTTLAVYGLLLGLWLFHMVSNAIWLKIDTRPPFWDTAGWAITSIRFSHWLATPDPLAALRGLMTESYHPPLFNWLSAPLGLLFWPTADVFNGVQVLFLGVLLLSTYHLGQKFGGRWAGLLAAAIVSMYPLVFGLSRHYLMDIALTTMVALSMWMLVRTDSFDRRGASAWYGLTLGLGLLTKSAFVIFAAGPLLVAGVRALRTRSRARLINLGLALVVGAAVAAPWYVINLEHNLSVLRRQVIYSQAEGDPLVASLASWSYYLNALVRYQVLLPFTLFFALGLAVWLVRRRPGGGGALLATWIGGAYLLTSLFGNKDVRYTLPYLPAVAIITALGLCLLRPAVLRRGLIVLLVLYAAFEFVGASWGLSRAMPAGTLPAHIAVRAGGINWPVYAESLHLMSPPVSQDWPVATILRQMVRLGPARPEGLSLTVLPNAPYFEPNVFMYYVLAEGLRVQPFGITGVLEVPDARARVLASDYVVAKTGDQGPAYTVQQAEVLSTELDEPSSDLGGRFEVVGVYPLPDGSIARLYKRILRAGAPGGDR